MTDRDIANDADDTKALSSLTGLSIEKFESDANLDIMIVHPEGRRKIGDQSEAPSPGGRHLIVDWARGNNSPCVGNACLDDEQKSIKARS